MIKPRTAPARNGTPTVNPSSQVLRSMLESEEGPVVVGLPKSFITSIAAPRTSQLVPDSIKDVALTCHSNLIPPSERVSIFAQMMCI